MKVSEINKLGKELELYTYVDYIGKGFPIILPNGAKVINIIRNYVEKEEERNGFEIVRTPNVSKAELYIIQDRLEQEKEEMFIIKSNDGEEEAKEENAIVLRPYVEPFHCTVYKTKPRSYKSFPIKYCETSSVYRDEKDIKGISRTRQLTLSDASIFTTPESLEKELIQVLDMQKNFIKRLGLDVKFHVSTWDDSKKDEYIGTIKEWDTTTKAMKNALDNLEIPYEVDKKAKMYGPLISIYYKDEEFASLQIDFEIVHRFDLTYANKENKSDYPIYIHLTCVGSYENLLSILIEKYKGEFPLWIAPLQVSIIPEGEEYEDYLNEIEARLLENRIRAKVDNSDTNVQNKEYKAIDLKIPYIITVGKDELTNKKIKVRTKDYNKLMEIDDLIKEVLSCQAKY